MTDNKEKIDDKDIEIIKNEEDNSETEAENDSVKNESVEKKADSIIEDDIEFVDYSDNTIESIDFSSDIDVRMLGEGIEFDNESKGKKILKEIFSYIKMGVIALLLALFINTFVLINANVPTGSMENTIMAHSRIIGSRLSYIFSGPERGDIAVFKFPLDEEMNYVKRVIGLPGETVKIINSQIYIYKDGKLVEGPLDEPYIKEEWTQNNDGYVFEVPEDSYLMLGDNRNLSADARKWYDDLLSAGKDTDIIYVHKDKIIGKVYFIYWYDGVHLDWVDGQDVNY